MARMLVPAFVAVAIILLLSNSMAEGKSEEIKAAESFFARSSQHTNNWAVLVCSSRFWFNYRHVADVLSMYRAVKRLGISDSNIILMLADNTPCNARNPDPATIYGNAYHRANLYPTDVEVDYRGYEVTAENFVRLLTGRVHSATPRSKQLLSDRQSNVLIYLSGHGGDGFLRFQYSSTKELNNVDLADAIQTMFQLNRYNELLVIADTCQSESMYQRIYSPRVLATSSSLVGEDSLSHHIDPIIGVYVIDRYAYHTERFITERVRDLNASTSMADFFAACPKAQCLSTVGVRTDLFEKRPENVRVTDFFGARRYVKGVDDVEYSQYEDVEFIVNE